MTDSSTHDVKSDASDNHEITTPEAMAELRSLLLGLEQSELDKLYERLKNPNIHPDDLSRILPEAIILRTMQDKLLSEAIVPSVEDAIQSSVKRDLNILSDAIFPVIAPASRKAISTALDATLQSFNQALEHSISLESLKWRLEARQTGKSFAEVVLLRTLLYQVEQVFLIHKETGLVLHHILKPGAIAQDADLVSAMLTAIQNFIQDSFNVPTSDSLETLQFGELTIWIEKGPQAVLAGVIRGHPPKQLKLVFQEALEKIHLKFSRELQSFQGDTSPFDKSHTFLEPCLQSQYKKPKKQKHYPFAYLVIVALLLTLATWAFFSIRNKQRWGAYLEKLNTEPGIIVTKQEQRRGKFVVIGLRDPLARDPKMLLKQVHIAPKAVISQWKPYLSLDPKFVATRTKQLLQPPATVSLDVGENGILYATGTASAAWILETRRLVQAIPGISKFDEENLIPNELSQLEASKQQIENQVLLFQEEKAILKPGQSQTIQTLVKLINKLNYSAEILDKGVQIQIIGHTYNPKGEQLNLTLSKARASAILSILASQGIKTTNLSIVGVGSKQPLRKNFTNQGQEFNRSVSFQVILTDSHNRRTPQ